MNTHTRQDVLSETLGLVRRIDSGDPMKAILEYRAAMAMCHSGGIVQGGFVTGWIDAAMAHAVLNATGYTKMPLSLEIKVSFLKPACPGLVTAEGWIETLTKSTAFLEGRLLDEAGAVVAKASSTAKLVPLTRS